MTSRINSKGKVEVINETFAESFATLNDMLVEKGEQPVSENFARNDFGVVGGETNAELQEWVNDYISEIDTEKAAEKQAWRYHQ